MSIPRPNSLFPERSQGEPLKTMEASAEELTQPLTSLDINREILKEVSRIYNPPEMVTKKRRTGLSTDRSSNSRSSSPLGLCRIGQLVKQPVSMGHHKAAVMIIGNISAGKSTFINWYVQESVQKTGMAIETSGFTYITSGRCVTEIGGESSLALRPQLEKLTTKYKGFLENLSLKTCPSKDGRLHLVDLIDTPGLADGELQYPFNVEDVIFEMRHCVDLFFVFFDPIGQALGKRMLSIVKRLNDACPDKVRFCLTKIDEVRTEEERIKVMCQTTQSLTAKISSRHGFDLVPIYIPGAKDGTYLSFSQTPQKNSTTNSQIVNRLKDLLEDIDRITERRIQDALNTLSTDINKLTISINQKVEEFKSIQSRIAEYHSSSRRYFFWRLLIVFFAFILGILHLKSIPKLAPSLVSTTDDWISLIDPIAVDYLNFLVSKLNRIPHLLFILWICVASCYLYTISFKPSPTVSSNCQIEYSKFLECHEFLNLSKLRWKQLNRLYLDHALNDSAESSTNEI